MSAFFLPEGGVLLCDECFTNPQVQALWGRLA